MRSALLLALALALPAQAELYKCIDAEGRVTYSETRDPKAKCGVAGGSVSVLPYQAPAERRASPAATPRAGQPGALQQQIAEQEAALAEAKKALQEQEDIRLGEERNYQRVLDRLKPYQDKVAEIEKRLAELRAQQGK